MTSHMQKVSNVEKSLSDAQNIADPCIMRLIFSRSKFLHLWQKETTLRLQMSFLWLLYDINLAVFLDTKSKKYVSFETRYFYKVT